MKKILIFFALLLFFLNLKNVSFGQSRYAACDLCGYCPPSQAPSSWQSCKQCLYPNSYNDPTSKDTLLIDPNSNLPPTPYPGHQYTIIGCISTDLGSFQQEGSAASVVQILLNIIIGLVGGVAFLYLIYGSFVVITSQSDSERLNYGKRLIYGAIIGLIFTLSSAFIINFIASGILKIPGF